MKDQVENLKQRGIEAAYLDSNMTGDEYGRVIYNVKNKKCKFLYVAPERLTNGQFVNFARQANITMVAIDEAHCVSQWGRSFRRDYYNIPDFIKALPIKPLIAAFTATATPDVRSDIIQRLEIGEAKIIVTGFDRPNLKFMAKASVDKDRDAAKFIAAHKHDCGIIYCATRRKVEAVTEFVNGLGYKALRYHAGLGPYERKENQQEFLDGKCNIIVATNAFGMGIDKPDVRWVLHYNMPKDLESYYQEAGRAGRDGNASECLLLFDKEDLRINTYLIEHGDRDSSTIAHEKKLLEQMHGFVRSKTCLRKYMLNYFGEKAKDNCGNCSNCNMKKTSFFGSLAGIERLFGE